MFIIWLLLLIIIGIGFVFGVLIDSTFYMTSFFIMASSLILVFTLLKNYTRFFIILLSGFVLRVILMFIDRFNIYSLPHSGDDTENFYSTGILISENMYLLTAEVYGGLYSKILGIMFNIYGDDRVFAQFLNIIIMMTAILITIEIFKQLNVPVKVQLALAALMTFFPHGLIFSSILLRESMIALFIVISVYFFIRWFNSGGITPAVISIVFLVLSAAFHSAVIGIMIGYIFAFIFYDREKGAFNITYRSLTPFVLVSAFFIYITTFPEVVETWPVFNKFEQVLSNNDNLYAAVTSSRGDMAYLSHIQVNNIFGLILFTPVKVIYFIGSPMPWSFRNLNDIMSFVLDGVFYLFVLYNMIKHFDLIRRHPVLFILMIAIVAGWVTFGIGISNAGTAIRHRFKFFFIVIVFLSVLFTKKEK